MELSNGKFIKCTKDHLFLTVNNGWQPLFNIKKNDRIVVLPDVLQYNMDKKYVSCQSKYSFGEIGLTKILRLIISN